MITQGENVRFPVIVMLLCHSDSCEQWLFGKFFLVALFQKVSDIHVMEGIWYMNSWDLCETPPNPNPNPNPFQNKMIL